MSVAARLVLLHVDTHAHRRWQEEQTQGLGEMLRAKLVSCLNSRSEQQFERNVESRSSEGRWRTAAYTPRSSSTADP